MTDRYWTGPRDRPRRYVVDASDGTLRHEPGGGVEGLVYRAVVDDPGSVNDGNVVALKLLLAVRPEDLSRVAERLEPLRYLDSPRLMRVRRTFVGTALTDDPHPLEEDFEVCYVVSDWIEGRPLGADATDREPLRALSLTVEIASAVAELHSIIAPGVPRGIVHRDLKTSNVRIRPDGSPTLLDYGLARPDTSDASVVGTPGWLAPEVAMGEPGRKPADVYGVGAIAHDLLVGQPPRRDGRAGAGHAIRSALGDSVALSAAIADHLASLLAIEPSDRPVDLDAWAADLQRLIDGSPLPPRRTGRRRLSMLAGAALTIIAIVVAFAFSRDDSVAARAEPSTTGSSDKIASTTPTTQQLWRCAEVALVPAGPVGDALRTAADAIDDVCPGAIYQVGEAQVLPLVDRSGEPAGALIARPTAPVVRLTAAQLSSYSELTGRGQSALTLMVGGYPTRVTRDADTGYDVVDLSAGGLMIGPHDDAQSFWVPQQIRPLWEEHGGLTGDLGAPTSPIFLSRTELRLEFERGFMHTPAKDGTGGAAQWLSVDVSEVEVTIVDPAQDLARLGDIANHVLRQSNGTAWLIGSDRKRHWIPDGPTWGCLQANEKLLPVDVAGYAIAAIELGARATCP